MLHCHMSQAEPGHVLGYDLPSLHYRNTALCMPAKHCAAAPTAIFRINLTPFVPPGKYETM